MNVEIEVGDSYLPLATGQIRDRFVLLEGPRGTSKTTGILSVLVMRALRYPGSTYLLARSTRTRLTDTVLVTLEEQVFPRFGIPLPGNQKREGRHVYRLPNGSSFVTMGLDDPQRTTSAEFSGIYVAEAIEIESQTLVEALAGSLRQARQPSWDDDFFHQCLVDTNPGSPNHWLNKIAEPVDQTLRRIITPADYDRLLRHNNAQTIDPDRFWKRIITKHQDNPFYFDPVAWEYSMAGAEYVNEVLAKIKSRHLRRRWLDGDWVAAEGTVFPEFNEETHVIEPFDVPTDVWHTVVGVDPGYDHPAAGLFIAFAEDGTMYVFDEVYGREMGVDGMAEALKPKMKGRKIEANYADPQHAFRRTFDSPTPISEQFRQRHNMQFIPWPKSVDKEGMVENFRRRLIDGKVKFTRNVIESIGEMQSWQYKRDTKGRVPQGDDQYEDKNNHAIDVILGVNAATKGAYSLESGIGAHQTLRRKLDPQSRAILQATLPSGMTPKELDRLVRGNLR